MRCAYLATEDFWNIFEKRMVPPKGIRATREGKQYRRKRKVGETSRWQFQICFISSTREGVLFRKR